MFKTEQGIGEMANSTMSTRDDPAAADAAGAGPEPKPGGHANHIAQSGAHNRKPEKSGLRGRQ